jgi:hypothetical protein
MIARRLCDQGAGPGVTIPILAGVAILWICLGFLSPGSYGGEDHFMHYLISRYAFQHPTLFLHQWGKPLFTTLSAPFSQFGIAGTALFNVLVSVAAVLFTVKTAHRLNVPYPHFAAYFVIFAPQFFVLAFSSMTEPLFACVLAAALFTWFSGRHSLSCMIVSLLPFARQEGYIFVALWAGMSIIQRQWRLLAYLALGPAVFAAVGAAIHSDLAWLVRAFPYQASHVYGSGDPLHYARRLVLVIGPVVLWHFVLGFYRAPILLQACWLAFFLAHALVWWQGMFASLGLDRVFVSIVPVTALIALFGLQRTLSRRLDPVDGWVAGLAAALGLVALRGADTRLLQLQCLVFLAFAGLFWVFKAGRPPLLVDGLRSLFLVTVLLLSAAMPFLQFRVPAPLNQEQQLISAAAAWLKAEHLDQRRMFFDYPFLSIALGLDFYDEQRHGRLKRLSEGQIEPGSVVVWDGHFGPNEAGIELRGLLNDPGYRLLHSFTSPVETRSLKNSPFEIHVLERTER